MKVLATKKAAPSTLPAKVAAVVDAVVSTLKAKARPRSADPFADDSRRRARVNAEAARRRAERARIVDELLAGDNEPGFLGGRRRGWLR